VLRPAPPDRRRLRLAQWLIIGVAGVLVVAVLASLAFAYFLGRTFDSARHTIAQPFPAVRAPVATGEAAHAQNILLLGQDVDTVDPDSPQFVGKQQADTIMLVHIPADRQRVYVMSVLRNSIVDIPGHGRQTVNAALAYGGMPLQVQTIEQLLGVRIDHVMSVSLVGLKGLTDALGGVTVDNPVAFANDGFRFRSGAHRLDGRQALAYVRAGSSSATGDAGRARAQTAYLRGVLEDVFRAKTLLNPGALAAAVSVMSPYLTVDKGLDSGYVANLGFSLRDVRADDVKAFTLPAPTVRMLGAARALELDRGALDRIRRDLRNDSLDELIH
jgi:LCP family protein required for cell wall assembly